MKRHALIIILPLLFCSLFFHPHFPSIEFAVYQDYIDSIVYDFDLNIANQRLTHLEFLEIPRVILTPQLYASDYHPYGMALLYYPFAILASLTGLPSFLSLATLFFSLFSLYLLSRASHYNQQQLSPLALWAIFFGTPLFFYTTFVPGNANIAAFFLSTILFTHIAKKDYKSNQFYFVWGALYSLLLITKIESIFYMALVLLPYLQGFRPQAKQILSFSLGLAPLCLLYLINNHKQFGKIYLSQGGVDFDQFILADILFSPIHGYLFTSPLLLAPFIYIFYKKIKNIPKEYFLYIFIFLSKLLSESFTDNSGVNLGARSSLIDLPFLLLFLNIPATFFKVFMVSASLWSMSLIPSYVDGFRLMNMTGFLDYYLDWGTYLNFFEQVKPAMILLIFPVGLIFFFLERSKSPKELGIYLWGLVMLLFVPLTINNSRKVFNLDDFPPSVVIVGEGKELWHLNESLSNFRERKKFLLYRNQPTRAAQLDITKEKYLGAVKTQIIAGEIGGVIE